MSNPWMKFYPSDWRADPALRMCSIGARGLWMEMLCIMHEANGYLKVNDKELIPRQLAALAGGSLEEITAWLVELSDAGVFSRDQGGVIYSRRMRKDIVRAEEDKANGRKGGNPTLKGGVNPPDNPPVGGGDKAQKPEARSQIPEPEKKKEEDAPLRVEPDPKAYAFEAGVIRLTEIDLARWIKAFSAINVEAELHSMADWARKQPSWFNACAGALGKRDRTAREKLEKIKAEAARGGALKPYLERGKM